MKDEAYKVWFNKAEDDYLNARSILTHRDGTPSGVCFLSQQMVEKYLKGLLAFHKKFFPKVHDLLRLETLLLPLQPELKEFHDDLITLNRYYIETRYPGDFPEFSWADAQQAFEAANKIKEFTGKRIKV